MHMEFELSSDRFAWYLIRSRVDFELLRNRKKQMNGCQRECFGKVISGKKACTFITTNNLICSPSVI